MRDLWEKWKVLAEKIGNFQANVIFSLFFFVLVTPFGLVANIFGDFLNVRKDSEWHSMEDNVSTLKKLKEQ